MSKLLTPLELKVMNVLWRLKKAFVKNIIEQLPSDPIKNPKPPHKPAYNTISTTVRILQEKEYVGHQAFGRTHEYFPIVTKTTYQKRLLTSIIKNAFSGSATSLVSALMDNEEISTNELDAIQDIIEQSKEE